MATNQIRIGTPHIQVSKLSGQERTEQDFESLHYTDLSPTTKGIKLEDSWSKYNITHTKLKFTVLGKPSIPLKKGDFVSIRIVMPCSPNGVQEKISVRYCKVTKVEHRISPFEAEVTRINIKFARDSMSYNGIPAVNFFVGKRMSEVFRKEVTIDPNNGCSFTVKA